MNMMMIIIIIYTRDSGVNILFLRTAIKNTVVCIFVTEQYICW